MSVSRELAKLITNKEKPMTPEECWKAYQKETAEINAKLIGHLDAAAEIVAEAEGDLALNLRKTIKLAQSMARKAAGAQ